MQAIVFDLDDTLYPEEEYVRSGFRAVANYVAQQHGLTREDCFQELWTLHCSGVRGDTFDQWLQALKVDTSVSVLVDIYREHDPAIHPSDGVIELLDGLRKTYDLGLITDGYRKVQRRKLRALRISGYFSTVVVSDDFGRKHWKPDAKPYNEALSHLNVASHAAVYIGDNPKKDFLGARRVGMRSIRLRREDGLYSTLEPESNAHAPDVEIAGLDDLRNAIRRLDRQ